MMKLTRPPEPDELKENKSLLTQEYANDSSKAVWRKDYIIGPLYSSANQKCAYCGTSIRWQKGWNYCKLEMNEDEQNSASVPPGENDHLHIDHFHAKKYALNKVVEWNNLVPSCPMCNCKKSSHNVDKAPIINPFDEEPRVYFKFGSILVVKHNIDEDCQKKAVRTIEVFQFIDRLYEQLSHYQKGVEDSLFKIFKDLREALTYYERGDIGKLNDVLGVFTNQLKMGLPRAKYGAFIATIILKHEYYAAVKEGLTSSNLWTDHLEQLEKQLKEIAYE